MYRNYVANAGSSRGSVASANSNDTNLSPPWATYNTTVTRPVGINANNNNTGVAGAAGRRVTPGSRGSRNSPAPGNALGAGTGTGIGRRERIRPAVTTITRNYASGPEVTPADRDAPFILGVFGRSMSSGAHAGYGSEGERARLAARVKEERQAAAEEKARKEVAIDVPLQKNVLTVLACDLHLQTNTKKHHTDLYHCTDRDVKPQLVIRRGQPFLLTFTFQRPWEIETDDVTIDFGLGETPSESDGTRHRMVVDETVSDGPHGNPVEGWAARFLERKGSQMTVVVFVPVDAIVGEWRCGMNTSLVGSNEEFSFGGVGHVFVIFNPWCPDDQVYFNDDPLLLKEYILNESGCLFQGNSEYIDCRPWFYGQFREGILDVCMTILRLAFDGKLSPDMADVVTVSRKLSRVLNNSKGDPGVMTGNWSLDFSGGENPSTWRGSLQILRQFGRTARPVNYAQCFVFSHVFTTVLRALGVPSRSLTTFESAHDTDKTVTIDSYQDEAGNPLAKSDSVWNYHCWNDVWVNRPDLDLTSSSRGRYSGWHAVDSTPQERSKNRFQCGPSPLAAIKYGEVSVGFDTKFIYGAVNGEVCTWMVPSDSSRGLQLIERDPGAVGKRISTKIPDGNPARGYFGAGHREVSERRMDITDQYKHPEGSEEERDSLKAAVGEGFASRIFQNSAGVQLEIGKLYEVPLGSNFEFKAILSNQGHATKEVELILGVYPSDYRGERIGFAKVAFLRIEHIVLPPNSREVFSLPVQEKLYVEQCDDAMSLMLRAFAKVKGEEKPLSKMKKLVLTAPAVSVKPVTPAHRITREVPFTVTLLITNPCSKPMTSCRLHLGGTIDPTPSQGFQEVDGTFYKKIKDIFPNEIRNVNIEVKAQKRPLNSRVRELDVDILSEELPDMCGSLDIELV